MKLLTSNTGDNVDCHKQDLLDLRTRLKDDYWFTCTEMGSKAYTNGSDQTSDMVSLGKLAKAIDYVQKAIGELSEVPRC